MHTVYIEGIWYEPIWYENIPRNQRCAHPRRAAGLDDDGCPGNRRERPRREAALRTGRHSTSRLDAWPMRICGCSLERCSSSRTAIRSWLIPTLFSKMISRNSDLVNFDLDFDHEENHFPNKCLCARLWSFTTSAAHWRDVARCGAAYRIGTMKSLPHTVLSGLSCVRHLRMALYPSPGLVQIRSGCGRAAYGAIRFQSRTIVPVGGQTLMISHPPRASSRRHLTPNPTS
ncbi:unnamed protein product, partial [Nesidiocoris tenuis]